MLIIVMVAGNIFINSCIQLQRICSTCYGLRVWLCFLDSPYFEFLSSFLVE